jgi:hypothetical protein
MHKQTISTESFHFLLFCSVVVICLQFKAFAAVGAMELAWVIAGHFGVTASVNAQRID